MPTVHTPINPDPFCDVRLHNIENQGRATDKFWIEVQDPETEEFVEIPGTGTVHSADYKLVTNRQVRDMAVAVMDDTGMAFEPIAGYPGGHSQPLYWNGRRFSEKWYVPDTAIDVPGGSSMMLGLEVTNSYDGSCKVGLAFFAMHLVCSNQFYSQNMMGRPFAFPHVNSGGNLEDDIGVALQQIQVQARNFAKLGPNMEALQNTHVTSFNDFLDLRTALQEQARLEFRDKPILDELSGRGITSELKMKGIKYEDPSSFWNIGNAYTAVCTHKVGGPRGADQSGRVVDFLLRQAAERAA